MSYTCDPKRLRIFGSHFNSHVKREIYSGLKMKNRENSAYDFFNNHGLRVNIETLDGTPLPDDLKDKLSLSTPCLIGSRLGKKGNNRKPKIVGGDVNDGLSELSSTVAVSSDESSTPVNVRLDAPIIAEIADVVSTNVVPKKPTAKRTRKVNTKVALA
jgi:hypothetical protein